MKCLREWLKLKKRVKVVQVRGTFEPVGLDRNNSYWMGAGCPEAVILLLVGEKSRDADAEGVGRKELETRESIREASVSFKRDDERRRVWYQEKRHF